MTKKIKFEEKAEKWADKMYPCDGQAQRYLFMGAKFGYNEKCKELEEANKADEWHYVKDGDLPKDTTSLYLVRVYSWDFGLSHLYKKYGMYIPIVCEWKGEYFSALDEMAYSNARNIKNCIAWKEIVLPKEVE